MIGRPIPGSRLYPLSFPFTKVRMAATLSDVSSELLFNETKYKVLIPNLSYENIDTVTHNDILQAADQRNFAFYGNH